MNHSEMLGADAWADPYRSDEPEEWAPRLPHDVDPRDEVDWSAWRLCRTCLAKTGEPCVALNGRVEGGRPDGVATPLPAPHARRQPRRGRRQNMPRM